MMKHLTLGISLIELMVSLSVLVILSCLSLPWIASLRETNQCQSMLHDLSSAIQYARNHALITGEPVRLKPLQKDLWEKGVRLSISNKVIKEWRWNGTKLHLDWRGFQSKNYLLFTDNPRSYAVNGTFVIHNDVQTLAKIIINRLGRLTQSECLKLK